MPMPRAPALALALLSRGLERISEGHLELRCPDGRVLHFGDPGADLCAVAEIRDERVFGRAVFGGRFMQAPAPPPAREMGPEKQG